MTTHNPIQNIKKYVAGIHQFITVGTGSTSVSINDIVSQADVNTMIIQNGNIGIGTTTPLYPFHVNAQSYYNANIGIGTTLPRQLLDVQGGNVIVSGNIGIGTTAPTQILDVQGGNAIFSANVGIGTTNANYRLVVGDNTARDEIIKVDSQGFAGLILNGDTANTVGELGGAYVHLRVDTAATSGVLAMCQIADQDGKGGTLTGSIANSLLLHHLNNYPIQFGTNGTVKMTLRADGDVGIGTNSPFANLHIAGTSGTAVTGEKQLYIAHPTTANYGWYIGNQTAAGTATDLDFYFAVNRGGTVTEPAYIQDNVALTQMNFTGQHKCFVENMSYSNLLQYNGLIVSANKNKYIRMSNGVAIGKDAITISESLPIVTFTSNAYDKSVFGVVSSIEDPDKRTDAYGAFVTILHKEKGDTRAFINSLGEGAIWISDINGTLESGDYITSSIIIGYGMKQNDDILHNYTVAKITMNCDFNPQQVPKLILLKNEHGENILDSIGNLQWTPLIDDNGQIIYELEYDIRYLQADGSQITKEEYITALSNNTQVYKAAFVGCTYHCG